MLNHKNIYSSLDNLIKDLEANGSVQLAGIVSHRLHCVAWTSKEELFMELISVLKKAMSSDLPQDIMKKVETIVSELAENL